MKEYIDRYVLLQKKGIYSEKFEAEIVVISDSGKYFKYRIVESGKAYWGEVLDYDVVDTITYD